jgi:hypothetical protein
MNTNIGCLRRKNNTYGQKWLEKKEKTNLKYFSNILPIKSFHANFTKSIKKNCV